MSPEDSNRAMSALDKANIKVVSDFCHSWNDPDRAASMLTADASVRMFYEKPAIIGAAAVGAAIKSYMGPAHQLNTAIHESIARGPVVVTVRTDTVTSPGKPDLVFKNVGVFQLKNGKIHEWIDYKAD